MLQVAEIYIALVDTPGLFATIIRRYLKQKYIHVVISMDAGLEEAYSVGRRNPFIPVIAGFEREDKEKICRAFPEAEYLICRINVAEKQKEQIRSTLQNDYRHRYRYHYAVAGLLPIVCGRPFYQKNHYTCSSYIARLLEEQGIRVADKHFSLVTPKDFYLYPDKQKVFEGKLQELIRVEHRIVEHPGAVYEY